MAAHRDLTAEEEAIFRAAQEAATPAILADEAEVEVRWRRWDVEPYWPELVLTPKNPRACPLRLSANPPTLLVGPKGGEMAMTLEGDRMVAVSKLVRDCVRATVEGRLEIRFRQETRRIEVDSWSVTLTLHLPDRDLTDTIAPRRIGDRQALTGKLGPADLRRSEVGPYTFRAVRLDIRAASLSPLIKGQTLWV